LSGQVVFPPGVDAVPGTAIELVLYEVTNEFVPHVADRTIYAGNSGHYVPFQVSYDFRRINPDREYILSAVVRHSDGQFVFISNETPNKVITFGNPHCGITIQLEYAPQPIP
jgi:uncharacterized lipoprotein YbaY